jgi:transcriptional antiterminator NusG
MKWYVVHTYAGQELTVKANIELLVQRRNLTDSIQQVMVPLQEVVSISRGKKRTTQKKHFPSYVLIEMEMNKDTMHYITEIPGVTNFIGFDGKPQAIRKSEVDRLLGVGIEEDEKVGAIEIPYAVGEVVRIKAGPFKDFDGNVEEIYPDKGKLKVMVSVFGRSTPVELAFTQVEGL